MKFTTLCRSVVSIHSPPSNYPELGMHWILILPEIRPAGYPAIPKAGYPVETDTGYPTIFLAYSW